MANRKDPKESLSALEKKLMTNLFENGKASVFSKPLASHKNFAPKCVPLSNSASVQPIHKLPRFPAWCHSAYVPAHYRSIEKLVSGPAGIDGQCVSSLLLSSGLPNPVLGKIWELCSGTVSGSLTQQELYAALALVAVVQAGYPPTLEVLFQLPQPPLPAFVQHQVTNSTTMPPTQPAPNSATTTWRQYPVPPNMHPPPVGYVQNIQHETTFGQDNSLRGLQENAGSHPAQFTSPATTSQSSVSLVDAPPFMAKVETLHQQPHVVGTSQRPAVWCSELRKAKAAGGILHDANLLLASTSSRGTSLPSQDSKTGSFDDFSDEFDDFMSAATITTCPANNSKDPFQMENLMNSPKDAGDFKADFSPSKQISAVTSAGDSLTVDFKGMSITRTESNSSSSLSDLEVKGQSSRSQKSSSIKTGKLTTKTLHNTKPFQFKIDISALTSVKVNTTKPSDPKPKKAGSDFCGFSSGPPPQPVEDDFADFQHAFPDTKTREDDSNMKCTGDRYSVLKEVANETAIQWSNPVTDDKNDSRWPPQNSSCTLLGVAPVEGGLFTEVDDSEDFGDFCHVTVQAPTCSTFPPAPVRSTEDIGFLELSSHTPEQVRRSNPSQDTISLGDRLSVYSLELGGRNGSSPSHHGSVLSLELRMGNSDGTDDDESPRIGSDDGGGTSQFADDTASGDIPSDTQEELGNFQPCQPAALLDKYSSIREVSQQPAEEGDCTDEWVCCLRGILEILQKANSFFGRDASSQVCREALETEEGANYVKNVMEVYKVCQRIRLASKLFGKQSETLQKLCLNIDSVWEDMSSFLENSCLFSIPVLPEGDAKWMPNLDDASKACGICLLHVDNPEIMSSKLTYGTREYHAPCANLWVNCIGSLLPTIPYPHLL